FIERSTVEEPALKSIGLMLTSGPAQFSVPTEQLAARAGCDEEVVRAIAGHLTRIGVIKPRPSSPDVIAGNVTGAFDALALAKCKAAAQEGTRARWRQYRAV